MGSNKSDNITFSLLSVSPTIILRDVSADRPSSTSVTVEVMLANQSQVPLTVNGRLQFIFDYKYVEAYELRFVVLTSTGSEIPPLGVIDDPLRPYPEAKDFVRLEPGSYCAKTVVISDYFDLAKAGTYQLFAEYHNYHTGREFGLDAWIGTVTSNYLQLIVRSK